jgi:membrane-associated phospholipid phosphatase
VALSPASAALALILLGCWPGPAAADIDGERRAGDLISFALPAATLGAEIGRRDMAGAGQFTRAFIVTLAATEVLKRSTGIQRPDRGNDQSFPSGHAARAFSAATYVHRRHGTASALPLYALATYVGHTRVQADRHRWVDVLGAAAVAALVTRAMVTRKPQNPALAGAPSPVLVHIGFSWN